MNFSRSRFLATGDSYRTIAFNYRVGRSTVSEIVSETCNALWDALMDEYMPPPTAEDFRLTAKRFAERWNFPNCIGSIDGKHVVIQAPANSGSMFYNYKGSFSVVLLALVDANYAFSMIDIGSYGRNSDGGTLAHSVFGQLLLAGKLDIPNDTALPGTTTPMPCVLVGDEAFPLRRNLMRPYPGQKLTDKQRIFNYRLSRARRIVENAFGILANRWRVFRRVIGVAPGNVDKIVKATCILHNYLRKECASEEICQNVADVQFSSEESAGLQRIRRVASNNSTREAVAVRDMFTEYFSSDTGRVPWQNEEVES